MQSLHYNSGSIKLTRERATMVSRWECQEVARWIAGLAGIQSDVADLFVKSHINGAALATLLRGDLIRMGITRLDQQLILMQSIDLLLTLVNRLSSETLALLFMRIHCTASTCCNILKRPEEKDTRHDNSTMMNSPEFYTSICNLSDAIVDTCHWLGRLPFIENIEYIDLRRKIIKALVQIRVLIRNLRLNDQINMPKAKLILEIGELRTATISLIRQNKDSLFSSDCYLTRVNLRRPMKDDVNIEYTTMPNFTHVISSIETEAMSFMGSGFSAINIGDEIIEINNQVVLGWDPIHFTELLRSPSHSNEICLLVKKMPRHNDDEVYTKRLADLVPNPRRTRARGVLERIKQQTQENRTMLLEQEGEIEVESDDETLYQSKRSSQIKRDQHSSLPDLTESIADKTNATLTRDLSQQTEPSSSSTSSISTSALLSPTSPIPSNSKRKNNERRPMTNSIPSSPTTTPKSPRKMGIESYFSTLFRPRHDPKSVIPDMDENPSKDSPQLVNVKRTDSTYKTTTAPNSPSATAAPADESNIQSPTMRSSISNIFRSSDSSEKKRSSADNGKGMTFRNELKMEIGSIFGNNNHGIVANKPPLNHSENRKNSLNNERRHPKPSYKKISCKDLGKGDCEGFLYRYLPKGTLSLVQWRLYWCVLKGGTLYVFKSKDDKNQEVEIKLEGKNVSPAPERRKYGFRIADESRKNREYFYCSTRDEMAKWMNKMGLAAINFNMDDSKIGGFHKGFVDSRESSPASTPILGQASSAKNKHLGNTPIGSAGDSENDSDKESIASWHKSNSHHSSISDTESSREKNSADRDKRADLSSFARHARSSSSSASILSDTNNSSIKSASNHFAGQINPSSNKGHHRTSSTPVCYPPSFDEQQDATYVNAAPRLSDSDSSSELPYQRMFINNQNVEKYRSPEPRRSTKVSTIARGKTPPFFSTKGSSAGRTVDEDFSSPSAPSLDIPNSSSSSSSAASPAATVRSPPLYISVYTSTPPIPVVKGTVSSSASSMPPSHDDDELFFTRRSPSPQPSSKVKQSDSPTKVSHRPSTSSSLYKYHPASDRRK